MLYDYTAVHPAELSIVEGETLVLLEENDSGWWKGRRTNGSEGLFPGNYVEKI